MSRYTRTQTDAVDAIQITFGMTREKIRAFDKHVMVSPDWDGWERWIMLPDGAREFCYGDWIVRGQHGGLWFCEGDVFADTYTRYESHRLVDSDAYYIAPREDLSPHIAAIDGLVAELAAASVTPFDHRKDIYLGGTV